MSFSEAGKTLDLIPFLLCLDKHAIIHTTALCGSLPFGRTTCLSLHSRDGVMFPGETIRNVRKLSNQDLSAQIKWLETGSQCDGVLKGLTDLHNSP